MIFNAHESKPIHTPAALAKLPEGWLWSRLDDISEGIYDCPHSTPKLTDSGPLVVRTQDISTGVFRTEQAGHVSEETYSERTARVVPNHGDILYSREGTYFGIAAEVPLNTRVCLGQRMVLIRPDRKRLSFRFLCYWLNSPVVASHISGYRDGTVAERLNLPTIRALPVLVPPLREQESIVKVLSSLDDKIELNRRMNATLEAMARALFKAWFVDFEPVHANLENRPATSASPEIAKRFPSEFENGIPRGWEEKPVGELLQFAIGGDWGTDEETEKNENQVCIVRGTDIPNLRSGNCDTAPVRFVQTSKFQKRKLVDGDIVIEVSGGSRDQATGRSLYFTDKLLESFPNKAVPASFCRLFRGINPSVSLLIGVYLQHLYDEGGTWEYQTQSTGISNFQTTHFLASAKIAVPNDPRLLEHFYKLLRPMVEKQQTGESAKLREIRDSLLPRLISGTIRVG